MISHSIPPPIPPNQPPPNFPTITLPSHTTWPCNQHTTQFSICFIVHYCMDIISHSNCSFHRTLPQRSETHLEKTPFPTYHTYWVIKVTELSSHIEYECWWATDGFRQCVNHGKTHPQDHPKGLVHGTRIVICSDKESFYLPFFTQTQLYILTNSVGLTQKIKDQAFILKLGKSTSQEINPNCHLRVLGAFGNWELRQLSAHYAVGKRTKNNPPLLEW